MVFCIVVELIYNPWHSVSLYFEEWERQLIMKLHGSIVICIGIDVNSLFSAWQEKSAASLSPHGSNNIQSLARDISQISDKPNCNKNSSINTYLNFVYLHYIYKYIYLRTLHAHLHTTPADTVHTPHTDEWLVASKNGFHNLWFQSFYVFILFKRLILPNCENCHFGCFWVSEHLLHFLYENVALGSVII